MLVGLFFNKAVLEFLVKILDKYAYKEFPKCLSKTELLHRHLSRVLIIAIKITQPVITCSKLTIEALEKGVKYVQS